MPDLPRRLVIHSSVQSATAGYDHEIHALGSHMPLGVVHQKRGESLSAMFLIRAYGADTSDPEGMPQANGVGNPDSDPGHRLRVVADDAEIGQVRLGVEQRKLTGHGVRRRPRAPEHRAGEQPEQLGVSRRRSARGFVALRRSVAQIGYVRQSVNVGIRGYSKLSIKMASPFVEGFYAYPPSRENRWTGYCGSRM